MTKIERRRATVTLNQGNFESELAALLDQAMAAQRAEETGATRRAGTKSKAIALAKQYDALLAEAEASAVTVDIYELSNTDWQVLADFHPPREGDAGDKQRGVNMKTFPGALLRRALPEGQVDIDELSRLHYVKLETAAWNLHNGDDALPKFSLVSLLKRQRDPDSKQPSDSE